MSRGIPVGEARVVILFQEIKKKRPQMTIWQLCMSRRIPKTINTNSQYVTLIDFPPQHWLQKRTTMLRNTHSACLFLFFFGLSQISDAALEIAM